MCVLSVSQYFSRIVYTTVGTEFLTHSVSLFLVLKKIREILHNCVEKCAVEIRSLFLHKPSPPSLSEPFTRSSLSKGRRPKSS